MTKQKTVIAAALGECVHVAGINNFLNLASKAGWRTIFLGPAVSIESLIETAKKEQPDLIGISYRLTPETGERLIAQFAELASDLKDSGMIFAFGGTPPVAARVSKIGFFDAIFDGSQSDEAVLTWLKGSNLERQTERDWPQTAIERILWKRPMPLLRHHFGLPTMSATLEGIRQIADARAIDVISLGIDQDAQANFFHPERQDPRRFGAGGVPVRSEDDYRALYEASRTGNFPLLRTYSGTDDFIHLAEMYMRTIRIAWCAIPLFWFNQMDGRGPWDLKGSIRQHQEVMRFYGRHGIPVELNEPHHWGMRDASDVVFVTSGFLAAYNAKAFGVKDYIAQLMFNSPPGLSDAMDLSRMLAILAMIEELKSEDFRVWKQTRTGLLSFPLEPVAARAHLAAATYLQMALEPDIVHIVAPCEADHAAQPEDVIEASRIVRRVVETSLKGAPQMQLDPHIQARTSALIEQSRSLLEKIAGLAPPAVSDPWTDPETLTKAVTSGLLDAPQLKNNRFALGKVHTEIIDGMSVALR